VLARFVKHMFTMNLPRNILVPVDLGEQTEPVLDYAVALAARLDAKIHLLHVLGRPLLGAETGIVVTETVSDEIIARCQGELDRLTRARASKVPFAQVPLRFGDPRMEIQAAAAEIDAELIERLVTCNAAPVPPSRRRCHADPAAAARGAVVLARLTRRSRAPRWHAS